MTKILGLSGKKQSGKNTACNHILGMWMKALGIVDKIEITEKGELLLEGVLGDSSVKCIFDIMDDSENTIKFRQEHLDDFIRVYSFADLLKQEVCMRVLGLTKEQCYGTDEQKNEKTHLLWENMPGVTTQEKPVGELGLPVKVEGRLGKYYERIGKDLVYHEPGQMTAREVMQFAGTEIFRKMYNDVWVDGTIRRIRQDNPLMAIITDTRFVNEVEGINNAGGKVIRLTRDIFKGQDQHESETALDNYPVENFAHVVDNHNMAIPEQCGKIYWILKEMQWLPIGVE